MAVRITPMIKFLLITCFATFIVQQTADRFYGADLMGWLALVPYGFVNGHRFWQIFTYAFLHADVMHLFLNLLMLVFIGGELEASWGARRFLQYYFTCSMAGGALYLFFQLLMSGDGLRTPMVGASGAIYGLLTAYGILYGERTLLFMMLFPMKAKHFVLILGGVELMQGVFGSTSSLLSSTAHLGGMVAGFIYLWTRATLSISKKAGRKFSFAGTASKVFKKKTHLKLVVSNEKKDPKNPTNSDPKTWH